MIIGMADAIGITPPPTSPTMREVIVDELCIKLVARIPVNNPRKGFEYEVISCSAKPFPNS
jgi:hypothetical protein